MSGLSIALFPFRHIPFANETIKKEELDEITI